MIDSIHIPMYQSVQQSLDYSGVLGKQTSDNILITGRGRLDSCYDVTGLATAGIAAAAGSLDCLRQLHGGSPSQIKLDKRLASLWFSHSLVPEGWDLPPTWDDIAGDYPARDGWIRLHTNAIHHREAALRVLGSPGDRKSVAREVSRHDAGELESNIVEANGCAARMFSREQWRRHPQGQSVAQEPLVGWKEHGEGVMAWRPENPSRPLQGLRVVDMTRVLAGPVGTRFLAAYGAEILRIDPVDLWDDSANAPEMTPGKRCAALNLNSRRDRQTLSELLADAELFIHGYRPGALEKLGFGNQHCRTINPALKTVSLCAYGWSGPWASRRGFDSLVQMSSGIAHAGMEWQQVAKPFPLPVQALDHATGYLVAAAAIHTLINQTEKGIITSARLSLARTAELLAGHPCPAGPGIELSSESADLNNAIEQTPWGIAHRLHFTVSLGEVPAYWDSPATHLGTSEAAWL